MEFANIRCQVTRTEEFADSEPTERATWFSMLCYCCSMENGGRIEDCRDWKNRKWEQMMGITKEEAEATCKLWTWEGNDIVVTFYPIEAEQKVRAKSSAGRLGGIKSGLVRQNRSTNEAPENLLQAENEAPEKPASSTPEAAPESCLNKRKGNEREENEIKPKGREGNETGAPVTQPQPPALSDIERCRQLIDYLSPIWAKMKQWGSDDEHALSEFLPNLLALERRDWQILGWFCRWVGSATNTQSRDPEKITGKRAAFIRDLASNLDRATRIWKANNCPALERKPQAETPSPAPQPEVPEFNSPTERAAYFASLLPPTR